jgi:hypothetical protein
MSLSQIRRVFGRAFQFGPDEGPFDGQDQ